MMKQTAMGLEGDSALRAMTDDGAFRVITARTTETVRRAIATQAAHGDTARRFGDLLTGAVLYRETMAPQLRVQAILRGTGGRGSLVADAHPDGGTRGLVKLPAAESRIELGPKAILQMMRSLPNGTIHQGVVEVPAAGGIPAALMAYMQTSEQVVSMIAVSCVMDAGEVVAAGGYLLQLLPEVKEGPLAVMTERLRDFEDIDGLLAQTAADPEALLAELLYGMPFTRLAESPVSFQCRCSVVRLVASLATLPHADLKEMVDDAKPLEITCDYCGRGYSINPEQLRGLLEKS